MGVMTRSGRNTTAREIWSAALFVAFLVFVSTTHVTTYLGARGRGRAKIWDIWRDLTTDLPGGGSDLVKVGYVLVVAVFVVSCFAGLWLTLSGESTGESPDEMSLRSIETS
jgi:hypothetical protein